MNSAHRAKVAKCRRMVEELQYLQSGTLTRQICVECFSDSRCLESTNTVNTSVLTFRVYTEVIMLEPVFLSLFLTFVHLCVDAYVHSMLVRMYLHICNSKQR